MKARFCPIVKQIWLLPFFSCLYCFGLSQTHELTLLGRYEPRLPLAIVLPRHSVNHQPIWDFAVVPNLHLKFFASVSYSVLVWLTKSKESNQCCCCFQCLPRDDKYFPIRLGPTFLYTMKSV